MNIIVGALITTLSLSPMPVSKETADTASLIVFEQTEEEKHAEEMILAEKEKSENFFYILSSSQTKYSTSKNNENRNYNMLLASQAINETIIKPGEEFSYNNAILSKRTPEKDYINAPVIVNGKLEDGIGGGICQISSTLYNAALYSGMTITQRRNHSLKVGYLSAGMDATVSWGSIDLCFRNDLDISVKIKSQMENGLLKIEFLAAENPNLGNITLNTEKKGNTYFLYRYIDGNLDYTAKSIYKN